jgi:hypothetical protein
VKDGLLVIQYFQTQRDSIEIAAMVKYRRALAPMREIEVDAVDVAAVMPASAA